MDLTNVQGNNYDHLGVSANPVYSSLRKSELVRSSNEHIKQVFIVLVYRAPLRVP